MTKLEAFLNCIEKEYICNISANKKKTAFFVAVPAIGGTKRILFVEEDMEYYKYSEVKPIGYYDFFSKIMYSFAYPTEFLSDFYEEGVVSLDDADSAFAERNIEIVRFEKAIRAKKEAFDSAILRCWNIYSSKENINSSDKVTIMKKCYYPSDEELLVEDVCIAAKKAFEKAVKLVKQ